MNQPTHEEHTATPADEAACARQLSEKAMEAIHQAYRDDKITDYEAYKELFESASKVDLQIHKLVMILKEGIAR